MMGKLRLRNAVAVLWGALAGTAANAQMFPSSVLPGTIQQRFSAQPAPLSSPPGQSVQLPVEAVPEAAARIRFKLAAIVVDGSTVYSAAELKALYEALLGKEVTAADIYAAASAISAKYGQDGYLVAKVLVVPQAASADNATIHLRVVEGYIERVELSGSAARYRDLWSACFGNVRAERPARTKTIERCLLLASDLPGLKFSSALKAGVNPNGGIVLVVSMTEKPFEAAVRVDNRGALGQGPWEQTTSLTEYNRLGWDESFNLTYATAFPWKELHYVGANWRQVLTPEGLVLDVNANVSYTNPGLAELRRLNYLGDSRNAEGGLTYPVIRAREQNLRLSALLFDENAATEALGARLTSDRLRGFRARANFDETDAALGTVGLTQLIATFSKGLEGLGSTRNGDPLASIAGGRVDFSKIDFTLSRMQTLAGSFSVYGAISGQAAESALLAAEQCFYGGAQYGRAFYTQQFSGDRCLLELGELRFDFEIPHIPLTHFQLYGFIDHGDLWRVGAIASSPAHVGPASSGVGLRVNWKDNLSADLQLAKSIGKAAAGDWRCFVAVTVAY
jgi:hemolysin activation/secretion protein